MKYILSLMAIALAFNLSAQTCVGFTLKFSFSDDFVDARIGEVVDEVVDYNHPEIRNHKVVIIEDYSVVLKNLKTSKHEVYHYSGDLSETVGSRVFTAVDKYCVNVCFIEERGCATLKRNLKTAGIPVDPQY